jgi:hypothetical protein
MLAVAHEAVYGEMRMIHMTFVTRDSNIHVKSSILRGPLRLSIESIQGS